VGVHVDDDPLSAVDTETERLLVDTLRPAVAGRTVLVATQRLSTVQVADRAVVLVDGRIVQDGAPGELLQYEGFFKRLFGDEILAA
jgi:ATP-binding cassette subfamily B protein